MKIYKICNIGNLGDKEEIGKATDKEKTGKIEINKIRIYMNIF